MKKKLSLKKTCFYTLAAFTLLGTFFLNGAGYFNPFTSSHEIAIADETPDSLPQPEAPPEEVSIIEILSKNDDFSTLVKALQAADLVNALKGNGPFTLFAPTNEAFEQLPPGTLQNLLKPENKTKLSGILTYHIVPGRHSTATLKSEKLKTLNSKELDVTFDGKQITVNNAKVTQSNIIGANGIIHIVDTVILPN